MARKRSADPPRCGARVNDDGPETRHKGTRPTLMSVPAGTTVTTTVTFQLPGEYKFICDLPGHEAYGIVGTLRVVPAN